MNSRYESAKAIYASYGVDTDKVIEKLKTIPVSMHCWQGDDVIGFDHDGPLTGGIQTTGNYPGKATNPEQLLADMDKAMSLVPGKKSSMYMLATQYSKKANLLTVTLLSPSTSKNG